MPVVKGLKMFTLAFEIPIAMKPLAAEKLFVVGVVEFFNHTISPRFAYWNEHRLHTKMQAAFYYNTK